ncbi:MAG: recombination protein NinG [Tissierellia bacterium]|nr:recombination protein NinG [Tissierellia bacterium]
MKQKSIKTLRNKLDKLFNTYIVLRDKKCILTKDIIGLQCSHYYDKKESPFLRWDERNAHAMANHKGNAVHFKHHHGKAPHYALWMFKHHDMKFMNQLARDADKTKIWTREEIIALTEYYTNKIRGLTK